jgi:hypothetical protein
MRLASLPVLALAALLALPACAVTKPKHHPVQTTSAKRGKSKAKTAAARPISMDSDRATQIQSALIREGYLKGEPTGAWDSDSAAAMQKMQLDNGWQTKIVPDSRALIKLGLGPQQTLKN